MIAGTNHWIPFTENEVNSRERFESSFMTDFIRGKFGGFVEENFNSPESPNAHNGQTNAHNGQMNLSATGGWFKQQDFIPTSPLQ